MKTKNFLLLLCCFMVILTGCRNQPVKEPNPSEPITEETYKINEDMLYEENIEEIKKQCDVYGTEFTGKNEIMYVEGKFGKSDVEGFYAYMHSGDDLLKKYFTAKRSMSKAYAENYQNGDFYEQNPKDIPKDNLEEVYETAKGIFDECTSNYGITKFTTLYSNGKGNWINGEDCENYEDFSQYVTKVINDEIGQVQFYGSTDDGHMFKFNISNVTYYIAFTIHPYKYA